MRYKILCVSYHSDLLPEKRQQRGRNSARPAPASSNYGCQGYVWGINQIVCRWAFRESHYQCHVQRLLKEKQPLGSGGQGKVCQGAMPSKETGAGQGLFWPVPQVWKAVDEELWWGYPELQTTLLLPVPVQHVSPSTPQPCSGERTDGLCPSALLWWLSPGGPQFTGIQGKCLCSGSVG